jgi:hypothetical protein
MLNKPQIVGVWASVTETPVADHYPQAAPRGGEKHKEQTVRTQSHVQTC